MKKLTFILILFFIPAGLFFAQDGGGPAAILEYFDNPDGVFVITSEGEDLFPEYGMDLYPGDKIKTTNSVAEIRLDPNGSLIKLATSTDFVIDTLQNRGGAEANTFSLLTGKLKAVAARTGTAQYQIKTQTAVCGVRGTTFGLQVSEGVTDSAIVEKGLITFQKIATGEAVELAAGQFADTFADTFQAVAATPEQFASFFEGIEEFVGENMNPDAVPGNEPVAEEGAGDEEAPPEEPLGDETVVADEEDTGEEAAGPSPMDPIMEYLRDVLGMEIGSITIEGKTYSKAVLQPEFTLGKLSMGLYLPIIYESNMFDPEDWYHPKGNDEWSFGSDYNFDDDPLGYVEDILSDTFLKIRYLQWGEQRDKFYLKVGNLDNMTIGHGLLMRNYSNNDSFPAIRRIGINTGFDLSGFGMEAVVNDLAEPEIFGGRLYFKLIGNFAVGFSGIVDIDPAGEIPVDPDDTSGTDPALAVGDPIFVNAGLDLDLPIIENDILSIVLFGDIGGMMPYLRNSIGTGDDTIESGLILQALYNPDADVEAGELPLRNYGIAAGVLGNIFIMDYRVEYRNYNGTFRPTFFNKNYNRSRGEYAVQVKNELLSPQEIEQIVGVYGEAGFNIADKFRLEAGYMWPWKEDFEFGEEDYLHIEAELFRGLIPVVDIHGSIAYDRYKFIPTLIGTDTELTLFDANTVVRGEVIYPVAPTLDLAILVSTTVAYDDAGNVLLDPDTGKTQVNPSISIETRVHF